MSEKFRLDRKIGFQNTFYTKCINVIIDSIGPSIILRSIFHINTKNKTMTRKCRLITDYRWGAQWLSGRVLDSRPKGRETEGPRVRDSPASLRCGP